MAPRKSAPANQPIRSAAIPPEPTPSSARKPWVKRTTLEVVLEQIGKQEKKVADMRAAVAHEERELAKLQQAKQVLEAK